MQAVPRLGVPDLDGLVLARCEDTVEASPPHTCHGTLMTREGLFYPAEGNVPYPNRSVLGGRCQPWLPWRLVVIRLPAHASNPFRVALERSSECLASLGVPESDGVVHAAGGEEFAIR